MTYIKQGDRIARQGNRVVLGVCGVLFTENGRLLLIKRSDNGLWALPGGKMEPGETVAETCCREVKEEVGMKVAIAGILGIYSNTDFLISYRQEDPGFHAVTIYFFVRPLDSGYPKTSSEVKEVRFIEPQEIADMLAEGSIASPQRIAVVDALSYVPGKLLLRR